MKVRSTFSVFLVAMLFFTTFRAWGDSSAMMFQPIYEDIAPGEIQEFFQDDTGYMWVGARNALFRYNAYEFKEIFIEETPESDKKSPHYTTEIFQDSDGTLWVTSHSGLFIFDQDREVLTKVTTKTGDDLPVYSENTHDILELPSGDFIIGLNDGFAILDKQTYISTRHVISDQTPEGGASAVYQIVLGDKQDVWLGARTGLFRLDLESSDITHFIPDPKNPNSQVDNALWSLALDRDGRLWGGTLGAGLYIFDPATELFEQVRSGQDNARGLIEDTIWDIVKDAQGGMWLAHDRNGMSRYDPLKDRFNVYRYNLGQIGSLIYNSVRSVFEDKDGNFWIGHYPGGISFYDRSSEAIRVYQQDYQRANSLGNQNVQAVMEDHAGNLWIAVGDGIDYFDRDKGEFKHYKKNLGTYPANGSLSGYIDSKGQVWIGTWTEGYHRYNQEKDLFEAMPVAPSMAGSLDGSNSVLNDATIWGFCETKDAHLWIGTHYAGINRYDESSKTFEKFKNLNTNDSLSNNIAWTCYEDSKGRFWVGTAWGLSLMSRETGTFKSYRPQEGAPNQLQSGSVMSIYEDKNGQLWLGTDSGLLLYQEDSDDFRVFATNEGLANQGIRAITADHSGLLWLGTNSGIVRFDPLTYEVKNYLEHVGQKFSGVNTGATLTTRSGEVVFGSVEGLIIIDPDKLSSNSSAASVVFTQFNIFTKPVFVNGPDKLLTRSIDRAESVTLDYTKKMFSFEFAALNFRSPENNHYAYKLDGFDQDWREIGPYRSAQYTNLSAGRYTFRVRASNNDGVWSEEGASIDIIQLPPPWKTWWAYLFYSVCLLALIGYFVYNQRRKRRLVEEQNRILELRVAERTADLAQKNKDIQSMLSNMRQGLFTIEESGGIHSEYSAYLESIYETQSISGSDAMALMFSDALVENDVLDQIEVCLCSIIGMDEMNYQLNSHLLVLEYQKRINGRVKHLSVDWSPIIDDGIVTKLMVSVRDVTDVKALEEEAKEKKRELDIIGQLLPLDDKKYKDYMTSARRYLAECYEILSQNMTFDQNILERLFRGMHTIKGNSRTHGLSYISNAAHNLESTLARLKNAQIEWDQQKLLEELKVVEKSLNEYESIYTGSLGRAQSVVSEVDGTWLSKDVFELLQLGIEKLKPFDEQGYKVLHRALARCWAIPIEEVISSHTKVLSSIADELGKSHPIINIQSNGILVKSEAHSLLSDVFSHLLRNTMDHGIETAEVRRARGANARGSIDISLQEYDEVIQIHLRDDGKGLDLKRLFIKGVETGLWGQADEVKASEVVAVIFTSGISTKTNLSEISGRGVGMDAVRHFLHDAGGEISIELDSTAGCYSLGLGEQYVQFSTCISLPKHYFSVIDN